MFELATVIGITGVVVCGLPLLLLLPDDMVGTAVVSVVLFLLLLESAEVIFRLRRLSKNSCIPS